MNRPVKITPATQTGLPAWADNDAARNLLAMIRAEQPETRVGDAMGFRVEEYEGLTAAKLRRIYREWLDAQVRVALAYPGREYADIRAALLAVPTADELIASELRPTGWEFAEQAALRMGEGL